jgi:hypothetical protein
MIPRTLPLFALITSAVFSQETGPVKAALEQRLGEVKQSMAQNQARLRQYGWTEATEISLKGEVKKREQKACAYGPDGKVQKIPIGAPPLAPEQSSGRRGKLKAKVVEKKVDELTDYMERVASLVHRYVPPNAESMQAAFQVGKASLNPAAGSLTFNGYVKPGDQVSLTFDPSTKRVVSCTVATYLDDPKDAVSVVARFSGLPDGTNFVEESILVAKAKQIQVKTTNSGYRKTGA